MPTKRQTTTTERREQTGAVLKGFLPKKIDGDLKLSPKFMKAYGKC